MRSAYRSRVSLLPSSITLTPSLRLLLKALDTHDQPTLLHGLRVANLVQDVAPEFGITGQTLATTVLGALFHDIGKLFVPDTVLQKQSRLDSLEWGSVAAHPQRGARLLERLGMVREVTDVVRFHHERWDGTGYPLGLRGTIIPPGARLVAVADAFDVMTAGRPYARARQLNAVLSELWAGAGNQWAPLAVQVVSAWATNRLAPVESRYRDHRPTDYTTWRVSLAS